MYNANLHDAFTKKYNVEEAILGGLDTGTLDYGQLISAPMLVGWRAIAS